MTIVRIAMSMTPAETRVTFNDNKVNLICRARGLSSIRREDIRKISRSFQSLIKISKNIIHAFHFTQHIRLVLLDIGQAFVRGLLVLERCV